MRTEDWAVAHAPADNAQATIAAAAVSGVRHFCTSITVTLEGAANTAALIFQLRNGATGAGTVIWTGKLCNLVNTSEKITLSGLNIRGALGAAMTLESSAAPAASSSVTVAMTGYSKSEPS